MSQITIYLPQDLHDKVRDRARELGLSLSAFMTNLAREAVAPDPTIHALEQLLEVARVWNCLKKQRIRPGRRLEGSRVVS